MRVYVLMVVLASLLHQMKVYGWFFGSGNPNCWKRDGASPYYFGTTDLTCMMYSGKKGKRSAPSRSTLAWSHRFIYYKGYYFEFGVGSENLAIYGKSATKSDDCRSSVEASPTGYSTISVDCLKRCTEKYKARYGEYNLFTHNCHYYANRISEILCNHSTCPQWCSP